MTEENKFKKAWNGLNNTADKINPIFNKTSEIFGKATQSSTQAFNKGSEKAGKGLDNVSNRAAGNKTIKCPRCNSMDVTFLENDRKKFSIGKAVGGNLLAGDVGTLAGFAGKKGKKNHWKCNECGNTFKA